MSYLKLFFNVASRCLFWIKCCKSKYTFFLIVIFQTLSKSQLMVRVLLLLNLTNIWAFIATQKYYANKSQQHLFFWGSCPNFKSLVTHVFGSFIESSLYLLVWLTQQKFNKKWDLYSKHLLKKAAFTHSIQNFCIYPLIHIWSVHGSKTKNINTSSYSKTAKFQKGMLI